MSGESDTGDVFAPPENVFAPLDICSRGANMFAPPENMFAPLDVCFEVTRKKMVMHVKTYDYVCEKKCIHA